VDEDPGGRTAQADPQRHGAAFAFVFHDSENGMMVLDPAFYTRMKPIYDDYLAHSNPVATNVTIPWAYRLLFDEDWVRQAF
jgi:hypothetical protein